MAQRRVAILGSTGSIGVQALEVIEALNGAGEDFQVVALLAHRNAGLLAEQAARWRPRMLGLTDPDAFAEHRDSLQMDGAELLGGPEALAHVAGHPEVDVVVHAIVGAAGLAASFAAAEAGKRLALANKESLVVAGPLLIDAARRGGATLLPIDSEHSAVFQALQCGRLEEVDRILLTASGGPFRTWPIQKMHDATVADALAHPTWAMGDRITIGSATLFNKALEIIEAVRLFDVRPEQVQVVIHPESIVHSMVEFCDGSVMAQLSPPDMRLPISYALTWPRRRASGVRRMDWTQVSRLHFEPPDEMRFPALRLAREALSAGGTAPAVLNAANEVAVERFLAGELAFGRISRIVEVTLEQVPVEAAANLSDLRKADAQARIMADLLARS